MWWVYEAEEREVPSILKRGVGRRERLQMEFQRDSAWFFRQRELPSFQTTTLHEKQHPFLCIRNAAGHFLHATAFNQLCLIACNIFSI